MQDALFAVPKHQSVAPRDWLRVASKMRALRAQLRDGTDLPLWFQFTPENYDDEGQLVDAGQLIAFVGSTGLSTGAHLHWEMSVHGILVDGLRFIDGSNGF